MKTKLISPKEQLKWIITDWTGTTKFNGQFFDSFGDAEEFLSQQLGDDYETDRGEFDIVQGTSRDSRYLDEFSRIYALLG